MAKHADLLDQGPREAPEPETAEERSRRMGLKSAGGVVAGGGAVAAKAGALGGLGKAFVWLFAWNGVSSAFRIGGWVGIAVLVAIVATVLVVRHNRRHAA
jgi:hypothetical protein